MPGTNGFFNTDTVDNTGDDRTSEYRINAVEDAMEEPNWSKFTLH